MVKDMYLHVIVCEAQVIEQIIGPHNLDSGYSSDIPRDELLL